MSRLFHYKRHKASFLHFKSQSKGNFMLITSSVSMICRWLCHVPGLTIVTELPRWVCGFSSSRFGARSRPDRRGPLLREVLELKFKRWSFLGRSSPLLSQPRLPSFGLGFNSRAKHLRFFDLKSWKLKIDTHFNYWIVKRYKINENGAGTDLYLKKKIILVCHNLNTCTSLLLFFQPFRVNL